MSIKHSVCVLILCWLLTGAEIAQQTQQDGTIIGTVIDVNNGTVPGATVVLEGPSLLEYPSVTTNDNGFFQLNHVNPETPYHVAVRAD